MSKPQRVGIFCKFSIKNTRTSKLLLAKNSGIWGTVETRPKYMSFWKVFKIFFSLPTSLSQVSQPSASHRWFPGQQNALHYLTHSGTESINKYDHSLVAAGTQRDTV